MSVGSRPSDTSEDPLVDALPVSELHRNRDEKEHSVGSHGNERGSKDANQTPKTLGNRSDDVPKNANETPKDTTVHLVRENETIKKNNSAANVNVSKDPTDANVHGTKPPLLGRPPGSHYKVGDPPRRPRKPVWLQILCNMFMVRMFISRRCA